eukprot:TRINITY_DN49741_c0_g1_i1.p4 TRINITY_DN49741_c0_g1~~TRINITY_DN49741_c0_g1_i1.p4  ORF type:complete len:174 (+),score=37.43 TRINITY_DN49741_c0_g1_i1:1076-1597(+)
MTTVGEINFSAAGMILCVYAVVARSARTILQHAVLTGDAKDRLGPLELLCWMCLPASGVFLALSAFSAEEGFAPYRDLLYGEHSAWTATVLLATCVNACLVNLAMLFATKELGAVGIQLVAQTKTVLVVFGGIAVLHEEVSRLQLAGLVVILFGVFLFSRLDQKTKASKGAAA